MSRAAVGGALALAAVATALLALPPELPAQEVPPPASHLGYEPGTDRRLSDWTALAGYYERLAEASDRVRLDTLGTTTRGRPLLMLVITSEENHARLEELKAVQQRLADPRSISGDDELEELFQRGVAVALITHGIHSSEVGSAEAAPALAHRLASSDEPEVREILDNVVVLQIPSLNPDGTEWMADWYMEWVGTEYEAAPLPWLYHYYVGHDNNRDWYAFTQLETRHVIRGAHNEWRPHVVHDVHQMDDDGPRVFLPPYLDPWEPNVDPALIGAVNDVGTHVAARLLAEGKEGVAVHAIYDAFTPGRAYQHYHAGARILSETAAARMATPDTVSTRELRPRRGFEPRSRSWNHPRPWGGGRWDMASVLDYMESASMAVLGHAARNRRHWLETAYGVNRRAVEKWDEWPEAWVIPADQEGRPGLAHLLRILRTGGVEVLRSEVPLEVEGRSAEVGSFVIPMRQPYAGFAQALLEPRRYPDLRRYPGGPPVRPYDATAHTLPLLMGVEALPARQLPELERVVDEGEPVTAPEVEYGLPPALGGADRPRIALYKSWREPMEAGWTRWLFDQHDLPYDTLHDADVRGGGLRERYDVIVLQSQSPGSILGGWPERMMPPAWSGGLGTEGSRSLRDFVRSGGRLVAMEEATDFVIRILDLSVSNAVERLPLEEFYVPGSLVRLTLEEPSGDSLPADPLPPPSPGGAGGDDAPSASTSPDTAAGSVRLRRVERSAASELRGEEAAGAAPDSPGSLPLDGETAAWFGPTSRAFAVGDPTLRVLARYGELEPLLSGWMLGSEHIAGRPALVEADVGRGTVVLFGFQPNYRGQSVATWPLLFDTLIPQASGDDAGGNP